MRAAQSLCDLLLQVCQDGNLQAVGHISAAKPLDTDTKSGQINRLNPSAGHYGNALTTLKGSILRDLHLTRADLLIIASLFQQQLEVGRPISVNQLLRNVSRVSSRSTELIQTVARLALDGIVTLSRPGPYTSPLTLVTIHSWPNLADDLLYGFEATISKSFLNYILDEQRPGLDDMPYESNQQFLREAYECCLTASRYFNVPEEQWRVDMYDLRARDRFRIITTKLNKTDARVPLNDLVHELDLEPYEQMCLWHLLHRETYRIDSTPELITTIVEPDVYSRSHIDAILSNSGKMQSEGLISVTPIVRTGAQSLSIKVSPDVFRRLTTEVKSSTVKVPSLNSCSNPAVRLTTPTKTMDQVILPGNTKQIIMSALESLNGHSIKMLRDWGVTEEGHGGGFSLLLHGQPGTGKTLTAEAIAGELKRQLFHVDISQVYGKYVGESEKNLRSVFNAYNDMGRRIATAPVLFLNECDQFLTRRVTQEGNSTDQMMNILQNMLLEFLENFGGVLIATTNLVTNLDAAFSRRFTHKIEIPWPDKEARQRLWRTLMPAALPLGPDFSEQELAVRYPFSGSQIRTVIFNAAKHVAGQRGIAKIVNMKDLVRFAELEMTGAFDNSTSTRIGFN